MHGKKISSDILKLYKCLQQHKTINVNVTTLVSWLKVRTHHFKLSTLHEPDRITKSIYSTVHELTGGGKKKP